MKLDFVLLGSGRYAAAFNPKEVGALEIIQERGGELYVYAYVDGINPILIDKDLTKKTAYLKMLDVTGVNIRVESTTPIREACYSGEATKIDIPTGKGEFGLIRVSAKLDTEECSLEYEPNCYDLGQPIVIKVLDNFEYSESFVLSESQYEKLEKIIATESYGQVECPIERYCSRTEKMFTDCGLAVPENLVGTYLFSVLEILANYMLESLTITYDGKDYTYKIGENIIIEQ